jgi:hypothetical protein
MTVIKTGYQKDTQGSWIPKDPQAQLVYSMDWSQWLPEGDSIAEVAYTLQVRANDPEPLVNESAGIQSGTLTYVELSGGQVGKIYTVTASITTADGATDRRNFRVKVENRSA